MDWRHKAVCRDEDPELFFPVGNSGPALAQIADAKLVCNRCPVTTDCELSRLSPPGGMEIILVNERSRQIPPASQSALTAVSTVPASTARAGGTSSGTTVTAPAGTTYAVWWG